MSKPVIGFIGVGFMGAGMAKNLVTKGYSLVIMGNKNREPVERLKALGCHRSYFCQSVGTAVRYCSPVRHRLAAGGVVDERTLWHFCQ